MTASWLAQMNWEVFVVDDVVAADFTEFGPWQELLPPLPQLPSDVEISAAGLHRQLQDPEEGVVVFDVGPSQQYAKRHIPGAIFIQRTELWRARGAFQHAKRVVLTSPDGIAARFAWPDATHSSTVPVAVLNGGTGAWQAQGFPADETAPRYACRPTDRYRRPYEGNDIDPVAMQAYLDWEYGLVRQLDRDGTHGFVVL